MPDRLDDLTARMKAAEGDDGAITVVVAEFALRARPSGEAERLLRAMDAAATLHWFDAPLLAQALNVQAARFEFETLAQMPFVEPYPARGEDARNVHEVTRRGWRKAIRALRGDEFRALSARAANLFDAGRSPLDDIEKTYHEIGATDERAADTLSELEFRWSGISTPSDSAALVVVLEELLLSDSLDPAASLEARFLVLNHFNAIGDLSRIAQEARTLLHDVRSSPRDELYAKCLLLVGGVLALEGKLSEARELTSAALAHVEELAQAHGAAKEAHVALLCMALARDAEFQFRQGDLDAAIRGYAQCLDIIEHQACQSPSSLGWQDRLGQIYRAIGEVDYRQGRFVTAMEAFRKSLVIRERLVTLNRSNTGWLSQLGVITILIGDTHVGHGDFEAAEQAHERGLAIAHSVAESAPANGRWQRGLAVAHHRMGQAYLRRGNDGAATREFEEGIAISKRLASTEPSNADWQRGVAAGHDQLGDVQMTRGEVHAAMKAFQAGFAIHQRLASADPTNTVWQEDLAASYVRMGDVHSRLGDLEAAVEAHEMSYAILRQLSASESKRSVHKRALGTAAGRLGIALLSSSRAQDAKKHLTSAADIHRSLYDRDPQSIPARRDLAYAYLDMAKLEEAEGTRRNVATTYLHDAFVLLDSIHEEGKMGPREESTWTSLKERLKR